MPTSPTQPTVMVPLRTKYRGVITVFLLTLFLFQQSGCIYWHRVDKRTKALPYLVETRKMIYLVSHANARESMWKIEHAVLTNDSITGRLVQIPEAISGRILDAHRGREARTERTKVLLHIDGDIVPDATGALQHGVSLAQITRIESFDVDAGATVGVFVLSVAVTVGLMLLLILALKSSCPFVYSHAPDGAHFEGEIFSGAIYPQLERHDRLPLQYLSPINGEYRITLANKAREVQSTDLLKLITVDHRPGTTPLFDKYGTIRPITDPQAPRTARDLNGSDILDRLLQKDELAWTGDPMNDQDQANDGMELVFNKPIGAATGKLVITARNTFWADHLYMLLLDEQGSLAPRIDSINATRPAEELRKWSRDQRLPLAVWMQKDKGKWERVEQFELAGPMAWRSDVLQLDLSQVKTDEVRIRLDCGFQFWEVDQVTMDFTPDTEMVVHELDALSATDQQGNDVSDLLAQDDDRHYVQPTLDDEAMVVFPAPGLTDGQERSTFLHGAGHYRILHETVPAKPDLLRLKRFQRADAFPKYSRERWRELNRTPMTIPL